MSVKVDHERRVIRGAIVKPQSGCPAILASSADCCGMKCVYGLTAWCVESKMKARPRSNRLLGFGEKSQLVSSAFFSEAYTFGICPDADKSEGSQDPIVECRGAIEVVHPERHVTKHLRVFWSHLRSRRRSINDFSWPPSISIMVPLTMCISGDASITTSVATSSTSAMRPSGIDAGASPLASS